GMDTIVYIVCICGVARQTNLDRFKSFRLATGAAQLIVCNPALPADILDMGAIFDTARDVRKTDLHLYGFQSLGLGAGSGGPSITDIALPTDILNVSLVTDCRSSRIRCC